MLLLDTDEQETLVDRYKLFPPRGNPGSKFLFSVLPTMTSICSCSWVKEDTKSSMCSQTEATSFSRGADWNCYTLLAAFPGWCKSGRLAGRLISIFKLVNLSKFLYVPMGNPLFLTCFPRLFWRTSVPSLLWKGPSNISCSSPLWNKCVHSSCWAYPSKNQVVPL